MKYHEAQRVLAVPGVSKQILIIAEHWSEQRTITSVGEK